MKNFYIFIVVFSTLNMSLPSAGYATNGENGIHDPSTIIKHEGVYHVYGTGDGIVHLTSTDLINWKIAATPFQVGTWPAWINNYVTDFGGFFWAPEIVKIEDTYYLYYSVSMGKRPSAIGVATSTDLENWTDQGMVIYSVEESTHGSIDPAVFADAEGNYWMAFGSHLRGIWITQIDPVTGKRPANATLTNVAGSGEWWSEHEAAYVIREGEYYYLFFNVGTCCALMESTYMVMMGRSKNVLGPYVDKNGARLSTGGGTVALATSGRFIGPGHFGLLKEGKRNILSLHYYDGSSNGYPRLDIASLEFDEDGWPVVTRDLVPDGTYKVASTANALVWETQGCTGATLQPLIQSTPSKEAPCQEWEITSTGNGFYKLKNAVSSANEQVVDIPFCDTNNKLATWDWLDNDCQKFKIEQHANGSFVFLSSVNQDKVIAVPDASSESGTQLATLDYSGTAFQRWAIISPDSTYTAEKESIEGEPDDQVTSIGDDIKEGNDIFRIYPNPTSNGSFTIKFTNIAPLQGSVEIINLAGKTLHHQKLAEQESIRINAGLAPGIYLVRFNSQSQSTTHKLIIN